jgi:hypothetical protein
MALVYLLSAYLFTVKFFKSVAQAFQPVPGKQVSRAQPGKAAPPAKTIFSCFTGEAKAHTRLLSQVISTVPQ